LVKRTCRIKNSIRCRIGNRRERRKVGYHGWLRIDERLSARAVNLMPDQTISINRAPVLTLWASVVAERLGFNENEALSLGRALAGLNAQAKGRRLGIFRPHEEKPHKAREKEHGEEFWIELCGRPIPARNTEDGIRAVQDTQVIEPDGVQRYLEGKFGDNLSQVRTAMRKLAKSFARRELAEAAFGLYERFRPTVPDGVKGWGAKGELDLGVIEGLVKA
jgi:hypothetical protein